MRQIESSRMHRPSRRNCSAASRRRRTEHDPEHAQNVKRDLLFRRCAKWMRLMQHRCEPMQLRVAKSLSFDRLHGRKHIVAIDAGLAVALQDVTKLLR